MARHNQIGVVWDFDNVWHSFKNMSLDAFRSLAHEASGKAIASIIPGVSFDEALRLEAQSYREYSDSFTGLAPLAAKAGIKADDFQKMVFQKYHDKLYQFMMERHPDYFDHMRDAANVLRPLRHACKHAILTHSDIEMWCAPIMTDVGMLSFFEPDALFGGIQCRFMNKSASSEPLRMAIVALGLEPDQIWFADDTLPNLKRAAEIPGVKKIYIHNGEPLKKRHDYVDRQFHGPKEFSHFLAARIISPPQFGVKAGRNLCL